MNDAPGHDEALVEQALRDILDSLDRHLERGRTLLAGALVLVVPAAFLLLYLLAGVRAPVALGWGILALGGLVALGLGWEMLAERFVCWRFNRRFPEGSASRPIALRILGQMETPCRAEEKLREALSSGSPGRIVRHQPQLPGPAEVAPLLELPPEHPAPAPAAPAAPSPATPRPGGYYDYIPLEPRTGDDRAEGEPR